MAGHALAAVEAFHGGGGQAHVELAPDEGVGDGVVVALDLDVVVDVDSGLLPFGEHVALGGKGSKRVDNRRKSGGRTRSSEPPSPRAVRRVPRGIMRSVGSGACEQGYGASKREMIWSILDCGRTLERGIKDRVIALD